MLLQKTLKCTLNFVVQSFSTLHCPGIKAELSLIAFFLLAKNIFRCFYFTMELSIQSYNTGLFINKNINFGDTKTVSKNSLSKVINDKDFLPNIVLYDTGICDFRLKSLIVEKRERMLQQYPVPPEYTYIDQYGTTRLKPHLFIKEIIVKPEFLRQGACRDAENRIVELSREEGLEGRVLLMSSPINGTRDYIPNPALAHWANGFRFYSSSLAQLMLNVLDGLSAPEYGPAGCMYYPINGS